MGCEKVFCGYRLDGTEWYIEVKDVGLQWDGNKWKVIPLDDNN